MKKKYFDITKTNGITTIALLFSELSIQEAEEFKLLFCGLVSPSENKFIIDMHKCNFLPSIAIGIFINFNAEVNKANGKAVFCCITEQVKTIFKITKLHEILITCDTLKEAIKFFI